MFYPNKQLSGNIYDNNKNQYLFLIKTGMTPIPFNLFQNEEHRVKLFLNILYHVYMYALTLSSKNGVHRFMV